MSFHLHSQAATGMSGAGLPRKVPASRPVQHVQHGRSAVLQPGRAGQPAAELDQTSASAHSFPVNGTVPSHGRAPVLPHLTAVSDQLKHSRVPLGQSGHTLRTSVAQPIEQDDEVGNHAGVVRGAAVVLLTLSHGCARA